MIYKIYLLVICFFVLLVKAQDYEAYSKVHENILHKIAQEDFDKAIVAADSLYKSSVIPAYRVRSLLLIATLYQQKNDMDKAISYAEKADEIIKITDDYAWQTRVNGFLASQYRFLKLYDKSRYYSQKALATAKKISNRVDAFKVQGLIMQELAHFDFEQHRYKEAIDKYKKAQEYFDKLSSKEFFTASNDQLMGVCYINIGEYKKAIDCYNKALLFTDKEMPGSALAGRIYQELALAYIRNDEPDKAKIYLDRAEEYARKSVYIDLDKDIYHTAQEYYTKKKDAKRIFAATGKKDSLSAEIEDQNAELINNKYLNLEKEGVEKTKKGLTKSILIYVTVLFILGNILFFIIYRYRQKKRINKIQDILNKLAEENKLVQTNPKKSENNTTSVMSEETEKTLLEKLNIFEQEVRFIDKNMSLSYMVTFMDTNTKYLSYIIKKYRAKDFTTYTNELRINYILKKLSAEPIYRQYKISALADEVGISSHSKFTTTFKNVTGVSPSEFIKFISKNEDH
ncbi:tetratricopeptide repeat protein [Elizabethkingia sp. HX WHF]|uniref:helix-turn-helix domain-containing protein n=1 Tax=Elizabethkingia TaxID=308865 RepID=UPI00099AECDE|nr:MULTISPECIES: helix-turn-helix domain-containing protein [Elizabethkingia]ATL41988.1 AraC family transcriptional regulator [Elizabethkingia miricola]MCL1638082.1 tetratricopeptide repeat protein [Elizabethkingia bruuniana]MDX8562672.1 tetratricopeptide repeat protein [Elizabethkingia sp. HX WHF]OPC23025.1 AraC family transcriptional regulator [Elizabethkingia bruuniana]